MILGGVHWGESGASGVGRDEVAATLRLPLDPLFDHGLAVALRVMTSLTEGVADQQRANRALQARIRALVNAAVPTDDDL